MDQTYCIYKLTNTLNGKGYVGFTSNFQRRLRQHKKTASDGIGQAIHAAIRKYGWENFVAEELYYSYNKQHTLDIEDYFINLHETKGEKGYNITRGGQQGPSKGSFKMPPMSDVTKQKISITKKGQHLKLSDYHKRQIGAAASKQVVSTEKRMKLANRNRLRVFSEETRQKMSNAKKGRVPWNKGKYGVQLCSEETRRKMSESQKRSNLIHPEKNIKRAEKCRGRKHDLETIKRMTELRHQRCPVNEESRQRMSDAKKGCKLSDATKEKMRLAQQTRRLKESKCL